jgi:hypothetical protein
VPKFGLEIVARNGNPESSQNMTDMFGSVPNPSSKRNVCPGDMFRKTEVGCPCILTNLFVLFITSKRMYWPGVNCTGLEPHLEAQVPACVALGLWIEVTIKAITTKVADINLGMGSVSI